MLKTIWVTWPALTKYGAVGISVALMSLANDRELLFKYNLFDTENHAYYNALIECNERSLTARTEDGTCNILENPAEGAALRRFGRNVPLESGHAETEHDTLLTPNPREVSNQLLGRDEFKPATSLNFIAAAWIQFMVHDWVSHGPNRKDNPIQVPLPDNDPLGTGQLSIQRTLADPSRIEVDADKPVTFQNVNTHWWDGSQLYGSDKETNDKIRSFIDGKLKSNPDKTLPTHLLSGLPVTGFTDNWWLGMSMMHQLFVAEHNAIADMLKENNPNQTDQWLYDKARLINAALMAKIHTIEWTPAIIANPVMERGMRANWYGYWDSRELRDFSQRFWDGAANQLRKTDEFLASKGVNSQFEALMDKYNSLELGNAGLVGNRKPDNAGVPYSLTEEFVAVYRMHPLMRDDIEVYDVGSHTIHKRIPMENTRGRNAEPLLAEETPERLWYSFGITHPGALSLKNYPEFLRNLSIPFVGNIDLATTEIIRDRERGVPRYNELRRLIRLEPIREFSDLTKDPELLATLKRIYNNDVEQIDALVGQLAETVRPEGFAFGETSFQIFIMNASRRLLADRFYTSDYRPEIYTPEGLDWVENNTMVDVLKRHYPDLTHTLNQVGNAFKPWGPDIPENYQSLSACDKQDYLWRQGVERSEYPDASLPSLKPIDVVGLIDKILWTKVRADRDTTPAGYKKPIHAHGVMAPVSFTPTPDSPYTGLFQGSECGLLRLSLTGAPAEKKFAPGLAWKAFVSGAPSENVSALYTLSGQGRNHDFFANELSQYVSPEANSTLFTSALFAATSLRPTHIRVDAMAEVDQDGEPVPEPNAPTQVYFVPSKEVANRFATTPHDFRDDLLTLKAGTEIYDVYATSMRIRGSLLREKNKARAKARRDSAQKIGTLTLTGDMKASTFGDSGIFFKHQRYEDK